MFVGFLVFREGVGWICQPEKHTKKRNIQIGCHAERVRCARARVTLNEYTLGKVWLAAAAATRDDDDTVNTLDRTHTQTDKNEPTLLVFSVCRSCVVKFFVFFIALRKLSDAAARYRIISANCCHGLCNETLRRRLIRSCGGAGAITI